MHPHSAAFSLVFALLAAPAVAQCDTWSNPLGYVGVQSLATSVFAANTFAAVEHDDGSGTALFVAGRFHVAGGIPTRQIARWDGASWSSVGGGVDAPEFGFVRALAVYDAGGGPELYAGGDISSIGGVAAVGIARWNGSAWSPVGAGLTGIVRDFQVHDVGQGPALYVSGQLPAYGGIARWDGTSWSALANTSFADVTAITVHSVAGVPRLHVGDSAGRILRRDGSTWTVVGQTDGYELNPTPGRVDALATYQGDLVVGGDFRRVDGVESHTLARLTPGGWAPIGSAVVSGRVRTLAQLDAGGGPELFVGGNVSVTGFGGAVAARWNGTQWNQLGPDPIAGGSMAIESFSSVTVPALGAPGVVVCGSYLTAGGMLVNHVARWNATTGWHAFGVGGSPDGPVHALCAYDDGTGPALYAGGLFYHVGATTSRAFAAWKNGSWSAMPAALSGNVYDLVGHDDGSGRALYAACTLFGEPTRVVRWNGSAWTGVGAGPGYEVWDLQVYDDGAGPKLYAAGTYAERVSVWDGIAWTSISGSGEPVRALGVHDDGNGPRLYAAIDNGTSAVLRWDGGTNWTQIGAVLPYPVSCLTSFEDATGAHLYAGVLPPTGSGGVQTPVWRYDGANWSPLGSGVPGYASGLQEFDAGSGPQLYVYGWFDSAHRYLLRWTGTTWENVGLGLNQGVSAVVPFFDGTGPGPALYVGGYFQSAGGVSASHLARLEGCAPRNTSYCFGDGVVTECPCDNASLPAERAGCRNSFGTGGKLVASGVASTSNDTLVLHGTGMTNSTALYFQGTSVVSAGYGASFGDGLRCAGGVQRRLGTKTNVGGASQYPASGDSPISVVIAVPVGATRYYQTYYRNSAAYCTSSTSNLTNGVAVLWSP